MNDFSTTTQSAIQGAAAALLAVVLGVFLLLVTGVIPPAPWSPLGQAAAQVVAPFSTGIFNPDATLDTSRMRDR